MDCLVTATKFFSMRNLNKYDCYDTLTAEALQDACDVLNGYEFEYAPQDQFFEAFNCAESLSLLDE